MQRRAFLCLFVLLLASCTSYVYQSINTRNFLIQENYTAALKNLEKANNGSSRLVYFYEKGLIHHYAGEYERSNEAFDAAELLLDDLYTRSMTREIGALLTSDNVVEYRGERYEAAMIHYYQILNYLYLSRPDAAVVECRQLNHKLQLFQDMSGSPYRNDPFLQYFTGMVYGEYGDRVDADVSLRNALALYKEDDGGAAADIPQALYTDLVGVARSYGDREAVETYLAEGGLPEEQDTGAGMGVLNLFLECGFVPAKIEEEVALPIYREDIEEDLDNDELARALAGRYGTVRKRTVKVDYWLDVALPALQANPSGIHIARIIAGDEKRTVHAAQTVLDFDALAFDAFEARKGTIILKTIARALTKYMAKKKVEDKKGELAGWMVNIFNVVTESADTRSWSTLPEKILWSRLVLPGGTQSLTIHLLDEAGQQLDTIVIDGVEIVPGRQTFLNYRIF